MSITPPVCTECGADLQSRTDDSPLATIDALISSLEAVTCALEKHATAMNYPGTDEFNAHTFGHHPFDDHASESLHALAQRVKGVSNDLYSVDDERECFAALTPAEQQVRTSDFEELAREAITTSRQLAGS